MLSFFGKKYIDVIGTIRVKDLIKKEYFHVRNRENELYIFLEKCFVTLGVIKVDKPDFNNYVSRAYKIIKKTYKKNGYSICSDEFFNIVIAVSMDDVNSWKR